MSPDSYLERFDPAVKIKRLEAEVARLITIIVLNDSVLRRENAMTKNVTCKDCANAADTNGKWSRCVACVSKLEAEVERLTKLVADNEGHHSWSYQKMDALQKEIEKMRAQLTAARTIWEDFDTSTLPVARGWFRKMDAALKGAAPPARFEPLEPLVWKDECDSCKDYVNCATDDSFKCTKEKPAAPEDEEHMEPAYRARLASQMPAAPVKKENDTT